MVWSPLNYSRPAWDLVFYRGFTFTSLALSRQLASWAFPPAEESWRPLDSVVGRVFGGGICDWALVRPLDRSLSMGAILVCGRALACFFVLPLRHSSGSQRDA